MSIETAYNILYMGSLIIFAILIGVMLVRSVIGPRITDRILSVNMIGTMIICCIVILSRYLDEGYLVDVALIYAMISFVSVLIYASTYIPAKPGRRPLNGRKKTRPKGDRRAAAYDPYEQPEEPGPVPAGRGAEETPRARETWRRKTGRMPAAAAVSPEKESIRNDSSNEFGNDFTDGIKKGVNKDFKKDNRSGSAGSGSGFTKVPKGGRQ